MSRAVANQPIRLICIAADIHAKNRLSTGFYLCDRYLRCILLEKSSRITQTFYKRRTLRIYALVGLCDDLLQISAVIIWTLHRKSVK
jgi:hypothetical protein